MRTAWITLTALLTAPSVGAAEGETALSVGLAYGRFAVIQEGEGGARETREAQGALLQLLYERGLGDTFWLRAACSGGLHDGPHGLAWSGATTAGLTYVFDVIRYVPSFHIAAGAAYLGGGGIERTLKPIVEIGAGLDVLESREMSWGIGVAFDSFVSDVAFFTAGARLTWRFGYF